MNRKLSQPFVVAPHPLTNVQQDPLSYSILISTDLCFYVTPLPLSLMPKCNLKYFQGPSYFLQLELVSSFSLAETGLSLLRVPLKTFTALLIHSRHHLVKLAV